MSALPNGGEVTETVVTPELWPDLTAAEAKIYVDEQIPYDNYAEHAELSRRALTTYQQAHEKWTHDTNDIQENWRWIDYVFRANALRRTTNRDVHVPELLKMHRALVPRLVEAFFGGSGASFFAAKGRDSNDRTRDFAITAMHEFQLEQNNFRSLLAPYCSSLCKYQVAIWKVVWEVRTQRVPYHWIEREQVGGKIVEHHKRQWKDVVTFVGNRIRLVDPANAIIDSQRWDLRDLAYFGDISQVPLHELMEQTNVYKNIDLLVERRMTPTDDKRVTPSQAARSGLKAAKPESPFQVRNTSEFVEVGELWCWFNWAKQGARPDVRQTIITVADNHTVLRLQENFHDDKHLPYAIARFSDNGFEFFDVGLYDPALRIQDEIDHFRGTIYEAADLILAPRAFTKGPAADLPNNIYDMPAGYIGKDVGDIVFMPIPNTLQNAPFIDSILRRDMEEIVGVPRLWQGTESGVGGDSTATEVRRKIEEGNRRLLGLVKSIDDGCVQLQKIMHANNKQFMVEKTKFRVLNPKLAKDLGGEEWEISPSDLMGPVDFTFFGVRRIQQYGLRGMNLLQFMQILGPIVQEQPEMFDMPNLVKQIYSAVVGDEVEDEVMRDPRDTNSMQDQVDENRKLAMGQRVPIHPLDQDEEHIQKMDASGMRELVLSTETADVVKKAVIEHYTAHDAARRKKIVQQQAMEQQAAQRQLMQNGPQENPGGDEAPPSGGLERGKRQTNGDGGGQQTPKSGRKAPIAQSDNE
jgi:hypothetical protein